MVNTIPHQKKYHRALLWVLLIISLIVLALLAPTLAKPKYFSGDDFFAYWAGGKFNLAGENPYDPQHKEELQIKLGGHTSSTYITQNMLNPPWAVALVMPFSLISYPISRLLWLVFSIGTILICIQVLWRLYQGPPRQYWVAWMVVFLFGPSILVLQVGQISTFILLGITLFLYLINNHKSDWLAGAALALIVIKPHLVSLFLLVLLFWVIDQRRWKILISGAMSVTLLSLVAFLFNQQIFSQYLGMLKTSYIPELATPTIGSYLRLFLFGIDQFWLQFLSLALGGIWSIYYWNRKHKSWHWLDELPLLLLVSLLISSYSWTYDQVILIPVVLQVAIWILSDWKRWYSYLLVFYYLIINVLYLSFHKMYSDFWFIWMEPAILIWYLISRSVYINKKDDIMENRII